MSNLPAAVPPKLKARQLRLIGAILTERTITAALEKAGGISRATWGRWQRDPAFAAVLADAVNESFSESLIEAKLANVEAVRKIRSLIQSGNDGLALSAAVQTLVYSLRVQALVHNEARLRALEEAAGLRKRPK